MCTIKTLLIIIFTISILAKHINMHVISEFTSLLNNKTTNDGNTTECCHSNDTKTDNVTLVTPDTKVENTITSNYPYYRDLLSLFIIMICILGLIWNSYVYLRNRRRHQRNEELRLIWRAQFRTWENGRIPRHPGYLPDIQ